jgi:hypothetical protein
MQKKVMPVISRTFHSRTARSRLKRFTPGEVNAHIRSDRLGDQQSIVLRELQNPLVGVTELDSSKK